MRLSVTVPLLGVLLFVAGCATSLTPSQFNEQLPKATGSRYFDRLAATKAIATGQCSVLVGGRKYAAPQASTLSGDLEGAALGIDEWVGTDGGNAYALSSFEWAAVGDHGGTQLVVYFDTLRCN